MSIAPQWTVGIAGALVTLCENADGSPRSRDELERWLHDHHAVLRAHLLANGGVLLRGFAGELREEAFHAVLDMVGAPMEDYVGGSTPRKRLSSRTYTATELGGEYSVALHQEMSYLPVAPEAIAFYCARAAQAGGRSVLADAREVARSLPNEVLASFGRHGILITRALPPRRSLYLASGISRPWQDVFGTDHRGAVLDIAAKRRWQVSWCDDGTLHLKHGATPAFRSHPKTGEDIWFNQAHYYSPDCMLRWAVRDGRTLQEHYLRRLLERGDHEHLNHVTAADGSPLPAKYLLAIWETLVAAERPVEMTVGDILLLDNYRVMHGRDRFSGARAMQAGLIATLG